MSTAVTPPESAPGSSSPSGRLDGGRRRRPGVLTILGIVLLAVGLSILGWAGWQFLGTNIAAHRAANSATQQLEQQWKDTPAAARKKTPALSTVPGAAVALMRIPDLGASWEYPVLVGTTPETLGKGVGWYSGTAQPGQVGNFAVAAHRITHGEPFRHLLELKKGATVLVETRDSIYTYQLDNSPSSLTVEDTAGWVLDPVPGKPTQRPTRSLITLTTCQDLFHSPDRSVAFGHLVSKTDK